MDLVFIAATCQLGTKACRTLLGQLYVHMHIDQVAYQVSRSYLLPMSAMARYVS